MTIGEPEWKRYEWKSWELAGPVRRHIFYPYFSDQPAIVFDENGMHEEMIPQPEITVTIINSGDCHDRP